MADNVTLPGTGAVVATEDVGGGVEVQLVKPVHGAHGTATDVSTAAPLPTAPYGIDASAALHQILTDGLGQQIQHLDEIRYLLEALLTRTAFTDAAGNLRVNLITNNAFATNQAVTAAQGSAGSAAWPVYSAPPSGYAAYQEQHYLSRAAFLDIRAQITVS